VIYRTLRFRGKSVAVLTGGEKNADQQQITVEEAKGMFRPPEAARIKINRL